MKRVIPLGINASVTVDPNTPELFQTVDDGVKGDNSPLDDLADPPL